MKRLTLRVLFTALAVIALMFSLFRWDHQQESTSPDKSADLAGQKAEIATDAILVPQPSRSRELQPSVAQEAALPVDEPKPPDGYTITQHHGYMTLGGSIPNPVENDALGPQWLQAADATSRLAEQANSAGRDWTFGYVEISPNTKREALESSLERLGGKILGSSGRLHRARLPGNVDALEAIRALPEVSGIGAVPREVKLERFDESLEEQTDGFDPAVFVTLMQDDQDGAYGRELESLGGVIDHYDADLRAYTVTADEHTIRTYADLDFVVVVESDVEVRALNDTSIPAMGGDRLRKFEGRPGVFSGTTGSAIPIGVMDGGLNINHRDIQENRESICGEYFTTRPGESVLLENDDLWVDVRGHGTHVTATLVGNGAGGARFAGMAPGVRHIRFAKVLHRSNGLGFLSWIARGMDWMALPTSCGGAEAKPMIVNMSLGDIGSNWGGRGVAERKLDAIVWEHGQLYVVAYGNSANISSSNYGTAKNSLAVGATHDAGSHAPFSSQGPTLDGRLAPQIVGVGVQVNSAVGNGSRGGYGQRNGTSMASPAVAGVATLLMDAVPEYRSYPALVRARLMASAVFPDVWLDDVGTFALDNSSGPGAIQSIYGLGKASANVAILDRDSPEGWRNGSVVFEPNDDEYGYVDIEVPAGASQLKLVLTWDEPPADGISNAVLNDLDLWLDQGGDCGGAVCGERSSTSRVDNVEWIVVRNPEPGTYRASVAAHGVYTSSPKAALAWTVIRGPSTPKLSVEADLTNLTSGDRSEVRVSLSVDGYVAAGTQLRVDCRGPDESTLCEGTTIESVDILGNDDIWRGAEIWQIPADRKKASLAFGDWFTVGEIVEEQPIEVRLRVRSEDESVSLRLAADAWNAEGTVAQVDLGTPLPAIGESPNDDFADSATISSLEGQVELDLFMATPEPGEPGLSLRLFEMRTAASVWYTWTAPSSELVHLSIRRSSGSSSKYARVTVFEGDQLNSLAQIGDDRFNVSFLPEEGRTYRIRVASHERTEDLVLRWSTGRPTNDDYAEALVVEGTSDSVDGTVVGATIERGEFWASAYGLLVETIWYRWTAPEDGDYTFRVFARHEGEEISSEDYVPNFLVFRGSNMGSLRLASTYLGAHTHYLTARAGEEFSIVVGQAHFSGDGPSASAPFTLEWSMTDEKPVDNDHFSEAVELSNATSATAEVYVDEGSTVEPGEPNETGVRTRWWMWQAPEDGRYTWQLSEGRSARGSWYYTQSVRELRPHVRAFVGSTLDQLRQVGEMGRYVPFEFATDVMAGDTLFFAMGFPNDSRAAFVAETFSYRLSWGPTPANDSMLAASDIVAESGEVSGSNAFATNDAGLRFDLIGRAAVWWEFEAPSDGWYRFSASGEGGPWLVTVHDADAMKVVASSRWQHRPGDEAAVIFYASSGSRHKLSLGVTSGGRAGEYTLRWNQTGPPQWLRYAGRMAQGDLDHSGNSFELGTPGDLEFGDEMLFLASDIGLTVFNQDAESGGLDFVQTVDGDLLNASLAYDADRSRLFVHDCGSWSSFPLDGEESGVGSRVDVQVSDDDGYCGRLLVSSTTGFVYRISEYEIETFLHTEGGGLRFAGNYDSSYAGGAVLSPRGHLYLAGDDELVVLETEETTGELSETKAGDHFSAVSGIPRFTVGEEGKLLFVTSYDLIQVFSLDEPLTPQPLGTLPKDLPRYGSADCYFNTARGESAFDEICNGWGYVVQWRTDEDTLSITDFIEENSHDRFNNFISDFGRLNDLAVSPDGRYIYVTEPTQGILRFERFAAPSLPEGEEGSATSEALTESL